MGSMVQLYCAGCFRHVHITEATLVQLNHQFQVSPLLTDPVKTFIIINPSSDQEEVSKREKFEGCLNVDSLTDLTRHRRTKSEDFPVRVPCHTPKYGECWGADMPFANISENRLAKTISMAVG